MYNCTETTMPTTFLNPRQFTATKQNKSCAGYLTSLNWLPQHNLWRNNTQKEIEEDGTQQGNQGQPVAHQESTCTSKWQFCMK